MNDRILITGTGSGVGLSLVRYLSQRFHVIAIVRSIDKDGHKFQGNGQVTLLQLDLSDPEAVETVIGKIADEHGYIPYLINNAGVNIKSDFDALNHEKIMQSFQVNAFAPAMILRKLLPGMKQHNFGRVINITSGAPLNCFPQFGAYSASKAALNAFTVTAARENSGSNIKINLMSPGPVRTNMAPEAPMDPSVCHPTVDYLLTLDEKGPTGRFFWLGYEIPLFPNLEGIHWLEGRADDHYRKVF